MRIYRTGIYSRKGCPGFTFLEIVVVLFIIGLLLLLVYPKIQIFTEDGLRKSSRHLIGVIHRLYYESMKTRKILRLSYDLQAKQYQVQTVDSHEKVMISAFPERRWMSLPQGIVFQDVVTLRQGKVTEGEAFTQFFPIGLVDKTVIHLTDRDQRALTLDVNPLTGRVKVHEGYVEIN